MSALTLKILACVTMLLDHIGYEHSYQSLRIVGRIAFPIFLFLIYNGYKHTKSPLRYCLRLGLFALISQIPFSLFLTGGLQYQNGNVFFSLLAALICLWSADRMARNKYLRFIHFLPALVFFLLYHYNYLRSDYGAQAVLLIMVLYYFYGKKPWQMALTTLGMLLVVFYVPILTFLMGNLRDPASTPFRLTQWEITQAYSLLALLPIFCYNGKKGMLLRSRGANKIIQWGFYLFYPAHLTILWLLRFI